MQLYRLPLEAGGTRLRVAQRRRRGQTTATADWVQLIFFAHLDDCPECWDEVYNAVKAQHPHYYKTKSRLKISDREIKQFEHKEREIEVA